MTVHPTPLQGLILIEPKVFGDARGFFFETWHRQRYRDLGIDADFVQDNLSFSRLGILRGLHYQKPAAQGKLVMVLQGEVFEVAVDLRRSSSTFGQSHGVTLSAENKHQFYVPPGFAHGFAVVSESALFHYKCTEFYSPRDEQAIRWNDPALNIPWPIAEPTISAKDAQAPSLKDIPPRSPFRLIKPPVAITSNRRRAEASWYYGDDMSSWRASATGATPTNV